MALLYDTNYSQKSLSDLTLCLGSFNEVIKDAINLLEEEINSPIKEYIDEEWQDLGILLNNTHGLFKTAQEELSLIAKEIPQGIQENHTKRLATLGKEFGEMNRDFGKAWSANFLHQDTKNQSFWKLQFIYEATRDTITTLSELIGITERLKDFVSIKHERTEQLDTPTLEAITTGEPEDNYPLETIKTITVVRSTGREFPRIVINKTHTENIRVTDTTSKEIRALLKAIEDGSHILETERPKQCENYLTTNKKCRLYRSADGKKQLYQLTKIVQLENLFSGKSLKISPKLKVETISNEEFKKRLSSTNYRKKRLN